MLALEYCYVSACVFYYDSDYDASFASQKTARLQQALKTHCLLIRLNGCLAPPLTELHQSSNTPDE